MDLIVLRDSDAFVGLSLSTTSLLVRELRAIVGQPRSTNMMVGDQMNEVLFSKAMVLKEPL